MTLTLSISGLSLEINRFTEGRFPRTIVDHYAKVEYSFYGSNIGDGSLFVPKFIWAVGAVLTKDEARLLSTIYSEFDTLRRLDLSANILLIDTIQEVQERAPRTRAIAPGTSEVFVGSNHTSYFAQYNVWITSPPDYEVFGLDRRCNFTMMETDFIPV